MIKKNWKQFKKNFFKQCCQLIYEAKINLKPKYLNEDKYKGKGAKKEDFITIDYVNNMNRIAYDKNLEIRANSGSNQKSGISDDGVVNPDITFETNNLQNKTFFECKILGDNSKYITDGLFRFITEKYSLNRMPFYGMLGYVKNETASNRYAKLQSSIDKKKKELFLKSKFKKKNNDDEVVFNTVHSILNSKNNNNEIVISHILHSWEN